MGGISQSLKLPNISKSSCCLHHPTIYEMLPKFGNQTDMHVCLLKFGISAYFFFSEYIKPEVLTKFSKAYKTVSTSTQWVFLLMFGNLCICERPPTILSYQVLPMQIGLVNHLR